MKKRTFQKQISSAALLCLSFSSAISCGLPLSAQAALRSQATRTAVEAKPAQPASENTGEEAAREISSANAAVEEAADSASQELIWDLFPESETNAAAPAFPFSSNGTDTSGTEAESESEVETETESEEDFSDPSNFETEVKNVLEVTPETELPEGSIDSLPLFTLTDYFIMSAYPLPDLPKTMEMLRGRIVALSDSYSGEWSIYLKNLNTEETFIINDVPMKSASTMKLFIMSTVYDAIDLGQLERTSEIVDLLNNMIVYSSNEAANRLLSILGDGSYGDGIARVDRYIEEHEYSSMTHEYNGFEDTSTIMDSEHFNQISAVDCGRLLESIYHRTFSSRKICNEIEEMMLNQQTRYKIPRGLPDSVSVGNKTGEMDTVENDVAIVYSDACDYILCVFSADWDSKDEAQYHIQEISSEVYYFFNEES